MSIQFTDLDIWKEGLELHIEISKLVESFPDYEKFSLKTQLLRSSNSVIANIAESFGRYSYKDKIRVLYISRGELEETRSHLIVSMRLGYISKSQQEPLENRYFILLKRLNKYINVLYKNAY